MRSEVAGRRIKPYACFDFALRATLSMSGFGRRCTNVVRSDLVDLFSVVVS